MHVKVIVEVLGPKEGNSKELHCLHDVCSQHLWLSKTMGNDPSGPFSTLLMEMKHDRQKCLSDRSTPQKTRTCHIMQKSWSSLTCEQGLPKQFSSNVQNTTLSPFPVRTVLQSGLCTYMVNVDTASMFRGG